MKSKHSTKWKSSVQPRKQRKYVYNAPLHIKDKLLHVHLSKELRQKHKMRSIRVRTGDTIKVLRGTHKGKEGKVERVDVKNLKLIVSKIENQKLQGGSAKYPLQPSNCMIVDLVRDKRRLPEEKQAKKEKKAEQPVQKAK